MKTFLIGIGIVIVLILISRASSPHKSASYTKSGNCRGASESTLRFAPEPTAAMFPSLADVSFDNSGKKIRRQLDAYFVKHRSL